MVNLSYIHDIPEEVNPNSVYIDCFFSTDDSELVDLLSENYFVIKNDFSQNSNDLSACYNICRWVLIVTIIFLFLMFLLKKP